MIAIIKPEVRESEVVRFLMLADASKATKPSKELNSVEFTGRGARSHEMRPDLFSKPLQQTSSAHSCKALRTQAATTAVDPWV